MAMFYGVGQLVVVRHSMVCGKFVHHHRKGDGDRNDVNAGSRFHNTASHTAHAAFGSVRADSVVSIVHTGLTLLMPLTDIYKRS